MSLCQVKLVEIFGPELVVKAVSCSFGVRAHRRVITLAGGQAINWHHSHARTQSPGKKSLSLFPSDTSEQRDQPSKKLTTTECKKMIQQIPAITIM